MGSESKSVIWFEELTRKDVSIVGGKNASLGEMIRELTDLGIKVPPGFATTADAFRRYVAHNKLDAFLDEHLLKLEREQIELSMLEARYAKPSSQATGRQTLRRRLSPTSMNSVISAKTVKWRLPFAQAQPQRTCLMPVSPVSKRLS